MAAGPSGGHSFLGYALRLRAAQPVAAAVVIIALILFAALRYLNLRQSAD